MREIHKLTKKDGSRFTEYELEGLEELYSQILFVDLDEYFVYILEDVLERDEFK